jgi:hypothetical protein
MGFIRRGRAAALSVLNSVASTTLKDFCAFVDPKVPEKKQIQLEDIHRLLGVLDRRRSLACESVIGPRGRLAALPTPPTTVERSSSPSEPAG